MGELPPPNYMYLQAGILLESSHAVPAARPRVDCHTATRGTDQSGSACGSTAFDSVTTYGSLLPTATPSAGPYAIELSSSFCWSTNGLFIAVLPIFRPCRAACPTKGPTGRFTSGIAPRGRCWDLPTSFLEIVGVRLSGCHAVFEISVTWKLTVENDDHDTRGACVLPSGLAAAGCLGIYLCE